MLSALDHDIRKHFDSLTIMDPNELNEIYSLLILIKI
jgi:hypothetical protein